MTKTRDQTLWALGDQAAVSAGNFLTSLVLARSLSRSDFGTYSLLLITLLSINTLHHALVIYNLTLGIATSSSAGIRESVGRSVAHTLVLSLVWSLLLVAVLGFLHRLDLLPVLMCAMVAWHLQEVARQAFLASANIRNTILPDVLSYLGQATILWVFHVTNLQHIFLCIAATSAAALVWQLARLRPTFSTPFNKDYRDRAWHLGKFNLVANLMGMAILQIPSWSLNAFYGRAAVGSFQSIANLVGVANPIIFSMGAVLMPAVARASMINREHARSSALRYGLKFGLFLLPCFVLFLAVPHQLMATVYGRNSPYLGLAPLLRVFTLTFLLQYVASVVGGYEGGLARPQSYVYSQVCCLAMLGTIGLLFIRFFGVPGAVYASLLAAAARMISYVWSSIRFDRATELVQQET